MGHRVAASLAAGAVVVVLAGCGSGSGGDTSAPPPASLASTEAPSPSPTSPSAEPSSLRAVPVAEIAGWTKPLTKVVTEDEFDDNRNAWANHPGKWSLVLKDGTYTMTVVPGQNSDEDPSILKVSPAAMAALRVGTKATTSGVEAVSLDCAFDDTSEPGTSYYLFSVTTAGPAISVRRDGGVITTVAQAPEPKLADGVPVSFEAVCVRGAADYKLGLIVDGEPVLAVVDDQPLEPAAVPAIWTRALPPSETDKGVAEFDYYRMYAATL